MPRSSSQRSHGDYRHSPYSSKAREAGIFGRFLSGLSQQALTWFEGAANQSDDAQNLSPVDGDLEGMQEDIGPTADELDDSAPRKFQIESRALPESFEESAMYEPDHAEPTANIGVDIMTDETTIVPSLDDDTDGTGPQSCVKDQVAIVPDVGERYDKDEGYANDHQYVEEGDNEDADDKDEDVENEEEIKETGSASVSPSNDADPHTTPVEEFKEASAPLPRKNMAFEGKTVLMSARIAFTPLKHAETVRLRQRYDEVNFQRFAILLTQRELRLSSSTLSAFLQKNTYFAGPWAALNRESHKHVSCSRRISWNIPYIDRLVAKYTQIKQKPLPMDRKRCELCKKQHTTADFYTMTLETRGYDKATLQPNDDKPEKYIMNVGKNCFQTFEDRHYAQHRLHVEFDELYEKPFRSFLRKGGSLRRFYVSDSEIVDIDLLLEALRKDDELGSFMTKLRERLEGLETRIIHADKEAMLRFFYYDRAEEEGHQGES